MLSLSLTLLFVTIPHTLSHNLSFSFNHHRLIGIDIQAQTLSSLQRGEINFEKWFIQGIRTC